GPPQQLLDGRPLSVPRRKSRALLYYLAAHSAPVTREHLLALLWPDHDRPAAQQILRTSLHGLRKALGAALLVSDDSLALAPNADVDIRRFESALTPAADMGTLAAALELYDAIITDSLEQDKESRRRGDEEMVVHLISSSPRLPVSYSPLLPFTGRAAELQKLRELSTTRKLALIEGEPGIGKTR